MLDVLRRGSKSWFAKALLGLLVLSFGIWGIADYLVRGGGPEPAIIVGGQSFDVEVVRERFNEDLARLRRQGLDLRPEQALAFGLLDRTVRTFVQGAVLDESGQRLRLTVTDETLRGLIASDKQFQDSQGRFDRERLNRLLTTNGLTEKRYVELRRREMIREALIGPVLEGAAVPAVGADLLAAHISQRRSGTVVRVPLAAVAEPPAEPADPAALEPVYQGALARFTVPETRTVSLLSLTTAAVIKDITVSDEALQEAYDQRADQFAQPATRALTQGLFPSEEAARAALAEVRAGRSLEDATRAQTGKAAVTLPAVTRDGLPAPLGDAVFAQTVGQVSEPVQGPFGWHLFLVSRDTPAHTRALAEVKDELRAALAEEQAQDALYGLSTRLEDTLAGGATLEEAAAQVGGTVHTLTLRRDGSDAQGKPQEGLPQAKTFLTTVFGLQKDQSTPVSEEERGFFVARLDAQTPATPRPLAEVKTEVLALWRQQERQRAAETLADDLLTRARAGDVSLEALARQTPGVTLEPLGPVTRSGQSGLGPDAAAQEPAPRPLVTALFDTQPGALARVALDDGAAVLKVEKAEAPAPDVAARERNAVAQALRQSVADDLLNGFTDALAAQVGVTVNQGVLNDALQPVR